MIPVLVTFHTEADTVKFDVSGAAPYPVRFVLYSEFVCDAQILYLLA